jgi:hypothetical protein
LSTSTAKKGGGAGCSCGGCLGALAILLAVLVIGGGLLYRAVTTPYVSLAAVPTSDAAAKSAQAKLSQVGAAADQANSTGKPVPVSITLSDAEMTSLATDAISVVEQTRSVPGIDGIAVHAAGQGTIQVQGRVHTLLGTVPIYVALRLASNDQKSFSVSVTEARVGVIPLPAAVVGGIVDQVRQQVIDRLNVTQAPAYDHAKVNVEVGRLTIGATLKP